MKSQQKLLKKVWELCTHSICLVKLGGGSGIGRAVCQTLAREGARVAVVDLNLEAAQKTAQSIRGNIH